MQNEKRYFNKGINADDAFELLGDGEYINGYNMRWGTTDNGAVGFLETIGGMDEIKSIYLPDGVNKGWGGCEDPERNRILYFNLNSRGNHGIYCYDKNTDQVYQVLLQNQVVTGLNFKKFIHSCGVLNGCLYWTESDVNQSRRIDIDACIKTNHPTYVTTASPYVFPLKESVITVIRRPPSLPPTIEKGLYDTYFSLSFVSVPPSYAAKPVYNKIKENAYRFAWRFNYITNEISVFSPFSLLANRNAADDNSDTIRITLPVTEIEQDVKSIDIIAQDADTGKCYIIYTWDRSKPLFDGITIYSGYYNSYYFTGHQTGEFIDEVASTKQWDYVPRYAETMEFAKNRLKLGNYISGYNTPATNSLKCKVAITNSGSGLTTTTASYKNYRVSGVYYNTLSGSLPVQEYLYVVLELNNVAQPGYYKLGTGNIPNAPGPTTDSLTNFTYIGNENSLRAAILNQLNAAAPSGYYFIVSSWLGFTDNIDITLTDVVLNNTVSFSGALYKTGGEYETGIYFTDDWGRKSGVYRSNRITIPERTFLDASLGLTTVEWTLTGMGTEIPVWATNYHIVRNKNLYTRNFLQGKPAPNENISPKTRVVYVTKDLNDNIKYIDYAPAYPYKEIYIAVDVSCLATYGMGYTFQPKDRLKLFCDETDQYLNLEIITQDGSYVWCSYQGLNYVVTTDTGGIVTPGFVNGTYTNVPTTTNGKGIGLTLDIVVSGNLISSVTVNQKGLGYEVKDIINVPSLSHSLGGYLKVNITATALIQNTLFEIYSPYQDSFNEPFYDVSEAYKVLNPGTDARAYSVTSGKIPGDVYVVTRKFNSPTQFEITNAGTGYDDGDYTDLPITNITGSGTGMTVDVTIKGGKITKVAVHKEGTSYAVNNTFSVQNVGSGSGMNIKITAIQTITNALFEAMSPNDKYWKIWNTSASRPNFIDKIGEQRVNAICFSNTYVKGTKINGLSSFELLNTKSLPSEYGWLRKLKLARKAQADGSVLLVICEKETASAYIGEVEYLDTQGSGTVAKSDAVLGNINVLSGNMGTTNPESVFEYNGLVNWYDKRNGCFVRYANNGLFAISQNKLQRVAHLLSLDLTDDLLLIGGCDPHHKDFLFSIPKTLDTPPKGYLEDYETTVYPYDIYDGQAKTLVYKPLLDYWGMPHNYAAETFIRLGDETYSVSEGVLYKHNTSSEKIYGKPFRSSVVLSCNQLQGVKKFYGIGIEANQIPAFVHLRTELPNAQSSDLVAEDFTNKQGVLYAPFYRDRLDVNAGEDYFTRQMRGERLYGKCLLLNIEFDKPVQLKTTNVHFGVEEGHFINT